MNQIEQLVNDYYRFLREKTTVSQIKGSDWIEIATPFADLYNDIISIYATKQGSEFLLSDDGQTMRNLELSGVEIAKSSKRKNLLDSIMLNYGVTIHNTEFTTRATEQNFSQKKHNLISAIAAANDLYVLAKHTVSSIFREDVRVFLDQQENIIYTPYFISKGSVGLEFTFDFQIAYRQKEILIKAFNSINKFNLPHFLFTWDDVKQVREKQTEKQIQGLAIINDEKREVKAEFLEALQNKGAKYILWSKRNSPDNLKLLEAA
ncbi:MAG: DUF1828 domain-containing protein [Ignavibacteriaceae bacterium]|nr:DUF1828 domain-containing protein [Ignavibacteriaceae bacterium]